jgi:hypothetical protein
MKPARQRAVMPGRQGHRPGISNSPRVGAPYTGIGSRATPSDVLTLMRELAGQLARRGWRLRTGISPGADEAFFRGVRAAGGQVELYLPWPGFRAEVWADAERPRARVLTAPTAGAHELAARFHPDWPALAPRARLLLARDSHEVLGTDLASPSSFVVCWTAEAGLDGSGVYADGTGQALRIAHAHGIPVFNLARPEHLRLMRDPW